jgi:hypothetical protein
MASEDEEGNHPLTFTSWISWPNYGGEDVEGASEGKMSPSKNQHLRWDTDGEGRAVASLKDFSTNPAEYT